MARRRLKQSVSRAIQEALERLELDDQDQFAYQDGFRIARRIRTVLWKADEHPDGYHAKDFRDMVVAFAEGRDDLDPDEVALQFDDAWGKVRFPEGQDPLSFAFNEVQRSDCRVALSSEFPTESATEHAAILATMAEALCASSFDEGTCYLPARRIAPWLGRSSRYVENLKKRLVSDGTLRIVHPASRGRRCARIRYVAEAERIPECTEVL